MSAAGLGRLGVLVVVAGLLGSATAVASPRPVAAAGCSPRLFTSGFHEQLVDGPVVPVTDLPAGARSVPTWSGSFTTDGQSYPYTMVGTDPAAGSATTTVPVLIVPLRLQFPSTGCVLSGNSLAAQVTASPLFVAAPTVAGTTQYLDALQRGNFWSAVSTVSPNYHLLLGTPRVAPVQTLSVPTAQGLTAFDGAAGRSLGIVGGKWLYLALRSLLAGMQVDPGTLTVFLSYNTYATDSNPADCLTTTCGYFLGYHDAVVGPQSITTYAFASVRDFGNLLPPGLDIGSSVLSHEVTEWANDPFVHGQRTRGQVTSQVNLVPAWISPYDSFGCSTALEVADPLEDGPFLGATPVGGSTVYLLANMAFLPWFARESPSTSILGRYDALGLFAGPSTPC